MPDMTLHWSPRSPFVRKVLVAAHELNIFDRIRLVRTVVQMAHPNPAIMVDNPLGRIPALVRQDGSVLIDSGVICEFLDSLAGPGLIIPTSGDARWRELSRHTAATGILEILVLWRNERDKPDERQTPEWIASFETKVEASLARFEHDIRHINEKPLQLSCIALGCVLSYLDFRFDSLNWRSKFPALTEWHLEFCKRRSAIATEVVDDN